MKLSAIAVTLTLATAAAGGCSVAPPAREQRPATLAAAWRELEPGFELGTFALGPPLTQAGSLVRVLRIDPALFELRLLNASAEPEGRMRTAREWCLQHDLLAAINASMYQEDYRTSVSLMRTREHVNNPRLTLHRSVLAFDPLATGVPPVKILDLDCERFEDWRDRYGTFVQSIRMISCQGTNVWEQQPRRTSTAAIGTDRTGHVLFVHVRSPFTTHDLIDVLLDLPLELDRLMYAEGGAQAQLFVRDAAGELEFVGGYDADEEEGAPPQAWPIPNVIGIVRRPSG